ncbi:MAG TPA: riboflavin synthase [Chitinophagaceae bacterium]|nr:riboflavin synthase [Chitinophagaceae bacterium]
MFTGIIETTGIIKNVNTSGSNKTIWIESAFSHELQLDQSVSHSGVCLTVDKVKENIHRVTAIQETLLKTTLDTWKAGDIINLERALKTGSRLDGHFVQGHVDTVASCIEKKEKDGSWEYEFGFPKKFAGLLIEKGSVCVNGISLTSFDVKKKSFKVAIIPYTYEHTNMKTVENGGSVNIEFDMIGKYVLRKLFLKE